MRKAEKGDTVTEIGAVSLQDLRAMHADHPIAGVAPNDMLRLPDDQLAYVLSLIRGDTPVLPELPVSRWPGLIPILEQNKIVPLLYKRIKALPADLRPPAEAMDLMAGSYLAAARQSILAEDQLRETLAAFRAEGIRVLLLKGSATALTLYPDPAMRPLSDIDLMMMPADMPRAGAMLEKLGYACKEKNFRVSPERYHEEAYKPADSKKFGLDVQWNMRPYFMINELADVRPFFDRAIRSDLSGLSFESLDPVDAIVYDANHMIYGHRGGLRLNWIVDLALTCEKLTSPGQWAQLQQRSVAYLSRDAVEKALRTATYWSGLRLPEPYEDFSGWPAPSEKEVLINSYMMTGNPVTGLKLAFMAPGGLSGKARHILDIALPPRDSMKKSYTLSDDRELPAAYVRRWKRLLFNR